ncbi:ubiquitin carboxyl-terminal hydrolase MINDY-1 isoform X2 [Struthio camelus]|uniref:ubiquitin carboxyl-terminal hydrolase MINDY-1 isoform X2 n=1 Tax=Struthio camelus TaxID=8801 RepID=UPI0036042318
MEPQQPVPMKGEGISGERTDSEICRAPQGLEEVVEGEELPAAGQESQEPDGQDQTTCCGEKEVPPSPRQEELHCTLDLLSMGDAERPEIEEVGEESKVTQETHAAAAEVNRATRGASLPDASVPSLGAGAAEPVDEPTKTWSPSREREPEPDFYCVKWITWKGERTPIITQSENGPCPLLAIMNILFLQWKVKLPPQKEVITSDELMAHLGDCILSIKPQEKSEGLQLNFQQSPEVVQAVGKLSYNQLVEKIITCKHSSDSNQVTEGLIAEQFLESTASQLTYHGLCELTAAVKEEELSVFFRNNHFSTMIKHKGHLYLLVTDQGFLQEEGVVWESLHNVDGDSCFCDTDFHLSHALGKEAASASSPEHHLQQRQVDQDYMIALSLQQQQGQGPSALSDLELARQLQQEEYQQQQQRPAPAPAQGRAQPGARTAGERRQRQKQDSDCVLL